MPDVLWELFWLNRHLFNLLPPISANIIKELAHKQNFIPGMFQALHTFSRDLSHNVHLHLSTTVGGLSLDKKSWIKKEDVYFYHDSVKKMWRHRVITLFRDQFKAGTLILPSSLGFIQYMADFNRWTGKLYDKNWVAFLGKPTKDHKRTIEYLGKYLKRPPISETRIKKYDGENVTFLYLDHYTKTYQTFTLPVFDFIGRLISHIPDKHFRCLRYYGWLSNRTRGELLPLVYQLLKKTMPTLENTVIYWREMFIKTFGRDPLACPKCKIMMALTAWIFAKPGFK